jgi:uncharacterized repeat protein (TIGR01451 family)
VPRVRAAPDRPMAVFILRLLGALACVLLTLAPGAPAAAAPRTISNVATIHWELGGTLYARPSNRVDIIVSPPRRAAALDTFRMAPGGESLSLAGAGCATGTRTAALSFAAAAPASPLPSSMAVERTQELEAGQPLIVKLDRPEANRDPARAETLEVVIASQAGDRERLILVETAPDSGRFAGAIATEAAAPVMFDCRLAVAPGAMLVLAAAPDESAPPIASTELRILAPARSRDGVRLTKQASIREAQPGEPVRYEVLVQNPNATLPTGPITLTDTFPSSLRYRTGTVRIDARPATLDLAPGGRGFSLALPALAPGASMLVSYVLEVRGDARAGEALNRAVATDSFGTASNIAEAAVRIRRDGIAERMTIWGRVVDGGCTASANAPGLAGVRIMLEDGSYAVTDADGRYHFQGVRPGTHVVQLDDTTLPADRAVADCARTPRSAGQPFSRFVDGRGGALKRVDFHAVAAPARAVSRAAPPPRPEPLGNAAAAGAERDWLAGQAPGTAFLFPEADHVPRAPIVRVAIKHAPGQTVRLLADGRAVDPVAFDGVRRNEAGDVAVSLWRGIPLETGTTRLAAEIRNADGTLAETLQRIVHYGSNPMQAALVPERSLLVADGVSRPVLAIRLTDRDGRPVRHGLTGDFEVPAPYRPAVEAEAQQARQLAGLERARPFWRTEGDEGIAYVELEPTTASGTVSLRFTFRDGEAVREQRIEAWLDPGERPWTLVGLAEGTIGFNRLMNRLEDGAEDADRLMLDGRIALYAKGRVRGRWLMTLAYDSDAREDKTRFGGIIDPDAYYTVYADRSEHRHDAASVRRLYLKLERPQFYALFGDYETGIDEPELARYVRAMNGVKAEYRSPRVAATAFAADTPNRFRRDEIQGNGLSGPYALGARDILVNSERITIEVRDRLRSDRIVERRLLARYTDYDIDYAAGTLRFRAPVLSRSDGLDPQFIIAEYEVDGVGARHWNAGARASWRSADERLQVAATAIRDADAAGETLLAGADLRYRPAASTEIRAEIAVSDHAARGAGESAGTATAWQIEAEHHGSRYDLLAYVRERQGGFGLGNLSPAESGTRKFGFDGRARFGEAWSLTASAWHETYLLSGARRIAGRALAEYRGRTNAARAGIVFADDQLADGRSARSTLLQLGASQRLFANRLEIDAQTELPIGNRKDSVDFPARHRLSGRYQVTSDVQLIGAVELADGRTFDARTFWLGFDLKPWAGARIALTGNRQEIGEYGPRSFAAYGLSQSLVLGPRWTIDFSIDGSRTLGGIDPARVLNPLHPAAPGGFVGGGAGGRLLTEDFTALTAGATYRAGDWSVTGRGEYRAGSLGDRYGLTAAALRQLGEGRALGGAIGWFVAEGGSAGARTSARHAQLSWAHRPADGAWSWLQKLELREDRATGAIAGVPGPLGLPLGVTGDVRSRRMVNALSINYTPQGAPGPMRALDELSLFWGARYVSDAYGDGDVKGFSNVLGVDARFRLGRRVDIGGAVTVRHGLGARSLSYSAGPSLGLAPADNMWLSVGWNIVGFHDRDFSESRYTRAGPYVTMRLRFDQLGLQALGLGARR